MNRVAAVAVAAWILWVPGNEAGFVESAKITPDMPVMRIEVPRIPPRAVEGFETKADCMAAIVKRKGADKQKATVYECWPAEFTPKGYHQ